MLKPDSNPIEWTTSPLIFPSILPVFGPYPHYFYPFSGLYQTCMLCYKSHVQFNKFEFMPYNVWCGAR